MNRSEKRKVQSELKSVINKAKIDMEKWMSLIDDEPTMKEVRAWQSGYIYGMNRAADEQQV